MAKKIIMSAPPAFSRDTRAKLNYFASHPPPEVLEDGVHTLGSSSEDPSEFKRLRQLVTDSHEVSILDATKVHPEGLSAWTLEKNGFTVIPAFPPLQDWRDREQVYESYIPQYVELVKKLTGGKDAVVLRGGNGYFYRNESPGTPTEAYSRFTHTDSGPDMIPALRRRLLREGIPEEEANTCDICVFNVWHPVERPAYQNPLCLLDATSVDVDRDHVKYKYKSDVKAYSSFNQDPKRKREPEAEKKPARDPSEDLGVGVQHNPQHRWVFIPDMSPDQVYLFVQYDTRAGKSGDGRATCTFHDSFHDPCHEALPKATHGRRSCEFRFFLTYPKAHSAPSKL